MYTPSYCIVVVVDEWTQFKVGRRRGRILDLDRERRRINRKHCDVKESYSKMKVDVDVRSIRVIPKSVLKIGVKLPEVVGNGSSGNSSSAKAKSTELVRR